MSDTGDLFDVVSSLSGKINFKIAICLFALVIFLNTNTYVEFVLSSVKGATDGINMTTKGTIITALILSLAYIALDLLVQYELL